MRARAAAAFAFGALGISLGTSRAAGQRPSAQAGAVFARRPIGLAGLGLEGDAGLYARLGVSAAGGVDAAGGRAVGELAATGRFLLDPLRQSSRGVYATGGLALRVERAARARPLVLAGLGVEGRPRGRVIPALEAGLGGGVRLTLVLRPTRPGRR